MRRGCPQRAPSRAKRRRWRARRERETADGSLQRVLGWKARSLRFAAAPRRRAARSIAAARCPKRASRRKRRVRRAPSLCQGLPYPQKKVRRNPPCSRAASAQQGRPQGRRQSLVRSRSTKRVPCRSPEGAGRSAKRVRKAHREAAECFARRALPQRNPLLDERAESSA